MQPSDDIGRLIEIMAALRDKDSGCPWDKEQTFGTIAPYTIEEAYEVADAIARGDMEDLRDELGDLLLQVVYHARMAEEIGAFAFGDVVRSITVKMIRRHPHVFGDADARTAGISERGWDEAKAAEKSERRGGAPSGLLDDVPGNLPALLRAAKLQRRAATVGFDWPDAGAVMAKLREEMEEVEAEIAAGAPPARVGEEIGDLLFAVVNLARHCGVDADAALRGANEKFCRRFRYVESSLAAKGQKLQDTTLDEMETLWITSKAKLP
jgi:ATP diphosphatase